MSTKSYSPGTQSTSEGVANHAGLSQGKGTRFDGSGNASGKGMDAKNHSLDEKTNPTGLSQSGEHQTGSNQSGGDRTGPNQSRDAKGTPAKKNEWTHTPSDLDKIDGWRVMNKKGKINEEEEKIHEKEVPLDISKWSIPVLKGMEELSVAAQNAGGVLIASKQQAEDILKNFAHSRVPIVLVTNVKVSGGANISKKMIVDVRAANNLMVPRQMYITQVTTEQEWPEAPTLTIEMNHGTIIVQVMINKNLVGQIIWDGFVRHH